MSQKLQSLSGTIRQLVRTIKENIQFEPKDLIDKYVSLFKLCITQWTIQTTAFQQETFSQSTIFRMSLANNLDWEAWLRIIRQKSQMTEFRFFYGLNFAHRVYLLADSLSKALQWENISVVEGKVTAEKTPENIWRKLLKTWETKYQQMCSLRLSSKVWIYGWPYSTNKKKSPNYKTMSKYFVKGG